jgi:hypothetical protein
MMLKKHYKLGDIQLSNIDIDHLPSPEELGVSSKETEQPSTLDKLKSGGRKLMDLIEAHGRGASEAVGINPEKLSGLTGAALEKVAGSDKDKSFSQLYDEYKKEAEKYRKEGEERSPVLSTVGGLTGAYTGSTALLGGLGKIAPALGELGSGKIVGDALGIAEKGGGIGTKLARAGAQAAEAAPLGALYGEGSSTADSASGTAKDIAMGAATATPLGFAGSLLGQGASALGKVINKPSQEIQTPILRKLQLAREISRGGVTTPTGEEVKSIYTGADQINRSADTLAKQSTEKLYGARTGLQDQYGKVLSDLDQQGITLTPKSNDLLAINQAQGISESLPGLFGSAGEVQQTRDLLNKFAQGSLTPSEAKQLQLGLRKATQNSSSKGLGVEQTKLESTLESVTDQLNSLPKPQSGGPGYQDINDLYREYSGTMGSIVNKGEIDPKYASKWLSDLKDRSDVKTVMSQLIDYVQKPGASSDEKRLLLNKVTNHFNALDKQNPGFLKSQGVDFNKINSDIQRMSDIVNVSKIARMESPEKMSVNNIIGTPSIAGATGLGYLEKGTQKIFNLPNEILRNLTPNLPEHVSAALSNAINTGDTAKKNAVLFSIMQNPNLRKLANKTLGIDTNEQK